MVPLDVVLRDFVTESLGVTFLIKFLMIPFLVDDCARAFSGPIGVEDIAVLAGKAICSVGVFENRYFDSILQPRTFALSDQYVGSPEGCSVISVPNCPLPCFFTSPFLYVTFS